MDACCAAFRHAVRTDDAAAFADAADALLNCCVRSPAPTEIALRRCVVELRACVRRNPTRHRTDTVCTEAYETLTGILATNDMPVRTVLLYGPPGTGKTLIARQVATTLNRVLLTVTPSDLMSQWVGETEKRFAQYFAVAAASAPAVVLLDECDALFSMRGQHHESEVMRRVKTQALLILQEVLDSRLGDVVVIAATNLPWELDSAILRRFEELLFVGLPTPVERGLLARHHLPTVDEHGVAMFADLLEGCTCAEVASAARAACRATTRQGGELSSTTLRDVALAQRRGVGPQALERYQQWQ
jgi:SpoVK/Ycf46/Vps4 family AAA+-type ATPase